MNLQETIAAIVATFLMATHALTKMLSTFSSNARSFTTKKVKLKRLMSPNWKRAKKKTLAVTKLIKAFSQQTALFFKVMIQISLSALEIFPRALSKEHTTTELTCNEDLKLTV